MIEELDKNETIPTYKLGSPDNLPEFLTTLKPSITELTVSFERGGELNTRDLVFQIMHNFERPRGVEISMNMNNRLTWHVKFNNRNTFGFNVHGTNVLGGCKNILHQIREQLFSTQHLEL